MLHSTRLTIEMLPAYHGDALLIRAISDNKPLNILVDAGTANTYHEQIKPRLQRLASAGESLDYFIITHIDADHIEGALELVADNGPHATPSLIRIGDVWHNSYRHLPLAGRPPTQDEVRRVQSQVSAPSKATSGNISARQGTTLAALLRKYNYPWNHALRGQAVVTSASGPVTIALGKDVTLVLLAPAPADLKNLERVWRRELLALGVSSDAVDADQFEGAFEAMLLAAFEDDAPLTETQISATDLTRPPDPSTFREDRSPSNGSSIAFLLHCGTKSALLLGDAHPSRIASQLRATGQPLPIMTDIAKLSHHGSRRSTSPDLLTVFRASHCFISTNGDKHSHPDIEALLWTVASQPSVTMHFNYPSPAANAIHIPEIERAYGHSTSIATPGHSIAIEA